MIFGIIKSEDSCQEQNPLIQHVGEEWEYAHRAGKCSKSGG